MADCFAMGILYKNVYNPSMCKEVDETIGSSRPQKSANNIKPNKTKDANICKKEERKETLPLLNNETSYVDEQAGFAKDSALGDAYSTNGKSNAY